MGNKRLITKSWLSRYHFKYDKERNLYVNHFVYPDQYKTEYVKYDYDKRILYTQGCYVVGADEPCEMNEADAYEWLKDVRYLFG